eukprot:TRINITY_DN5163_c1_g1_i1.p2 TRINITY_DN5163_c1_g1~~TRINITY_DN5163_c1_g1_i1.p2  ORF type:complete len:107 (-),score=12.55 TRINITY_DN5163_c1_g1_i1:19-339(-)
MPEDIKSLNFLEDSEKALPFFYRYPISHMFMDALHLTREYFAHSNLPETIDIIKEMESRNLKPQKIWLVGMSCSLDYEETNSLLEKSVGSHVQLAYDGLFLSNLFN